MTLFLAVFLIGTAFIFYLWRRYDPKAPSRFSNVPHNNSNTNEINNMFHKISYSQDNNIFDKIAYLRNINNSKATIIIYEDNLPEMEYITLSLKPIDTSCEHNELIARCQIDKMKKDTGCCTLELTILETQDCNRSNFDQEIVEFINYGQKTG